MWSTMFSLLFWDVLFMDVPNVFRTPFQSAPLDLSTPLFYPTRKVTLSSTPHARWPAHQRHCAAWISCITQWKPDAVPVYSTCL